MNPLAPYSTLTARNLHVASFKQKLRTDRRYRLSHLIDLYLMAEACRRPSRLSTARSLLAPIDTTHSDMEGSEVVKREPGSPLSPAETNLLGTSIHEPITWIYHDIEDDEEMLSSGRFGLDSGRKNPAIRYRQPRPLRKMEAFHSQKLWQVCSSLTSCAGPVCGDGEWYGYNDALTTSRV